MEVGRGARHAGREHTVAFYERESDLSSLVVGYVADGLAGGEHVVVVAAPEHRRLLHAGLVGRGIDVVAATERGDLVLLDAAATMARFLEGGLPAGAAFEATVGPLLDPAATGGRPVRVYGEMVTLLWDAGDVLGALELEELWNRLLRSAPASLLCAYPMASMGPARAVAAFGDLCDAHTLVHGDPPAPEGAECTGRFPRSLEAPARARQFVSEVLQRWGRPDLVEVGGLLVTELATNALRHAGSCFTVSLQRDGDVVRVVVGDGAPTAPVAAGTHSTEPGGHGLQIVEALSDRWGHDLRPEGKLVWVELAHGPELAGLA